MTTRAVLWALSLAGLASLLGACGQLPPSPAEPAEPSAAAAEAPPPPEEDEPALVAAKKPLGGDELRTKVIVLPGDARVEVDNRSFARRDGLIELRGKAAEKRRVRATRGARSCEWTVTLDAAAPTPWLDLDGDPHCAPPAAKKPVLSSAVAAGLKHEEVFE